MIERMHTVVAHVCEGHHCWVTDMEQDAGLYFAEIILYFRSGPWLMGREANSTRTFPGISSRTVPCVGGRIYKWVHIVHCADILIAVVKRITSHPTVGIRIPYNFRGN